MANNQACLNCTSRRKMALLISNTEYIRRPIITGKRNATELATLLGRLGFACHVHRELHIAEMQSAFRDFINLLLPDDMVIIYYVGHSKGIIDTVYNTSLTPKCRISVTNIVHCVREKIARGILMYIGDTCSTDKRNCIYSNCMPMDQKWFDKYRDRDAYNIAAYHNKRPYNRTSGHVYFAALMSSEPGTATYSNGTPDLTEYTAHVITILSAAVMRILTKKRSVSMHDAYIQLCRYAHDRLRQRPYYTNNGADIYVCCDKCP